MIIKKGPEIINGFIDKFEKYLSPSEIGLEERRKRILSGLVVIITAPVLLIFSALHLARADYPLGIFLLLSGLALTVSIIVLRKFKSVNMFSRIDIGLVGLLFIYLLAESGPHGYMAHWIYVYPLVTFFMLGRNEGLYFNTVFYIIVFIFLIFQEYLSWAIIHEKGFKARFLISLFLVSALAYTFEYLRHKFKEGMKLNQFKLEEEKKKLAESTKEAERANEAKSEFLSNMSHELRTPLNHIIGFTELVVDEHFGELNHQQKEYLGNSLTSSHHLLSLINDILDLSKVEASKLVIELSDVDLISLLENSLTMIREKAWKHGIKLQINMNRIQETIKADERKLKQIMYNLLSNAVKFTPDGGTVDLEARIIDCVIRKGCREGDPERFQVIKVLAKGEHVQNRDSGKFLKITVSDTGIGLNPEVQEKIFNPFEQVDNSASRRFQGTGLGLPISKKLVELHGGKIWVESEGEGKGSTFRFVIPIEKNA